MLRVLAASTHLRALLGGTAALLALGIGATRSLGFALLATVACFAFSEQLFGVTAFRPGDFGVWLSQSDAETERFVLTTFLTLLGILFAVWAASFTWRRGKRTELRLAAANEIHDFVQELASSLTALSLCAERLVELHNACNTTADIYEVHSQANYLISQREKVESARDRVWSRSVTIHGLRTKHGVLFQDSWVASVAFDKAIQSLVEATGSIYVLPPWSLGRTDFLTWLSYQDASTWRTFSETAERCQSTISMASGAIKGLFESDVIKPKFSLAWEMVRLVRKIREIV